MISEGLREHFPGAIALIDTRPPRTVAETAAAEWRGIIITTEQRRDRVRVKVGKTDVSAWVYGLMDVTEILSGRRARDGIFIRLLASGQRIWSAPGVPDVVHQASAAYERGPSALSRAMRLREWERIDRALDEARRYLAAQDAQIAIMRSLDVILENVFALASRWLPAPGARISALATVDPRLALAAQEAARTELISHARYQALERFVKELRDMYPPPEPIFRLRERPGDRPGGPLLAFLMPFRLLREAVGALLGWAPKSANYLWPIFRLCRVMRRHWRIPATILGLDFCVAILSLPVPFILASIVRSSTPTAAIFTAALLVVALVIQSIVSAVSRAYSTSAREALWVLWQEKFVRTLLHAKPEALRKYPPGELSFRFDDARSSFEVLMQIFTTFLRAIAFIVPTPFVLCLLPPAFALHVVIVILLLGLVYAAYSAAEFYYFEGITSFRGQLSSRMIEALSQIPAIRALGVGVQASRRIASKASRLRDEIVKLQVIVAIIGVASGAITTVAPIFLIVEGLILVRNGTLDAGVALGVGYWISIVIGPITSLFSLGPPLRRLMVRARRFLEVYDGARGAPSLARSALATEAFPTYVKELRIENLVYTPSPTAEPLWTLNAKIPLIGLTAIIGPSGAGKSTLLLLLNRTLTPTDGAIRIEKVPIERIRTSEWRRNVAIVPQEDFVLEGTVFENISIGLDEPPDAFAAESILRRVGLWSSLEHREGLETVLSSTGEGGGLSSGERKRLSLARALLRKPRIILVDEMVDLVDPELEEKILGILREMSQTHDLRVVFVAHRPSAVAVADRTIRLDREHP